jgi:SAM-dependent methyltransferase
MAQRHSADQRRTNDETSGRDEGASDPQPRNRTFDYARPLSDEEIAAGHHRRWVGGKWQAMGTLQRDFLAGEGLMPSHRLLDVGCGALRAGIRFVEYLDPGNYYGLDINASLLDVGYEQELPAELRARLPRENLRATDRFDCDFGVAFDYAIAQSVFTHVSLNHIRLCLYRVAQHLGSDGRFYATFFEARPRHPVDAPVRGSRWTEQNPFFYYRSDLKWAARWAGLEMRYIGKWGHPAGQRIVEFHRPVEEQAEQQLTVRRRALRLASRVKRGSKRR